MSYDMTGASTGPEAGRPNEGRALTTGEQGAVAQARLDPYGAPGYGMPQPGDGEGEGLAVIIRQYFYIVLKRKWIILSAMLIFTVLGGIRSFLKTPLYMATVRIQIEREPAKIIEGGAQTPDADYNNDFLRTQ